jgi:hypothetical protein
MFIGCDVVSIDLNWGSEGKVSLSPKAGENAQLDPGGYTTESDKKGITGDGQAIYKMSIGRWAMETPPIAWQKTGTNNLTTVKAIAASFLEGTVTITLADGTLYSGKGKIVDEIKVATFDSTFPIKLEGTGALEQFKKKE